jgi:4-hydroxybenzoyl-CoA reductase subunit beta
MEYLPHFDLLRPKTVDEALALRRENPEAHLLAGGTDLIVNIRRGIVDLSTVIDLTGIAEIRGIARQDDGGLRIGAAVTLAELLEDRQLAGDYPALCEAAAEVAASSHREVATVGGNLCLDTRCLYYNQSEWWRSANAYCLKHRGEVCHVAPSGKHCFAAFSGDLAPAVMVLGGTVEIAGPDGRRTVPLGEIYEDDGQRGPPSRRRPVALRLRQGAGARGHRLSPGRRRHCPAHRRRRARGDPHRPDRHQLLPDPDRGDRSTGRRGNRRGNGGKAGRHAVQADPADEQHLHAARLPPQGRRQPRTRTVQPPGRSALRSGSTADPLQ